MDVSTTAVAGADQIADLSLGDSGDPFDRRGHFAETLDSIAPPPTLASSA